jgi:hypothetical protein
LVQKRCPKAVSSGKMSRDPLSESGSLICLRRVAARARSFPGILLQCYDAVNRTCVDVFDCLHVQLFVINIADTRLFQIDDIVAYSQR